MCFGIGWIWLISAPPHTYCDTFIQPFTNSFIQFEIPSCHPETSSQQQSFVWEAMARLEIKIDDSLTPTVLVMANEITHSILFLCSMQFKTVYLLHNFFSSLTCPSWSKIPFFNTFFATELRDYQKATQKLYFSHYYECVQLKKFFWVKMKYGGYWNCIYFNMRSFMIHYI